MPRIDIVLATYDGEPFLAAQLDSIAAQTHQDWHLFARDDGSRDGTPAILDEFGRLHPDRVTVLRDADGNLGAARNFSLLLQRSVAPYVALCDQDDVWLPDKLSTSLDLLQTVERAGRQGAPAYVYSDLRVVDERLDTIDESYWSMTRLDPTRARSLAGLLAQNVVTGCSILLNRPLCDAAAPVPPVLSDHDWWVATVGSALGSSRFLTAPTVLYRQHGTNVVGARRHSPATMPRRALEVLAQWRRRRVAVIGWFTRAELLLDRHRDALDPRDIAVIERFLELPDLGPIRRAVHARRDGLLPGGIARSASFVALSGRRRADPVAVNASDP